MRDATRTHLILDGLHDPAMGGEVSRRWAEAGFDNAVDPAGQAGWIARRDVEEMTEVDSERAAAVARTFGVELRDRVGAAFVAANDAGALRERMAYEFKSRFATAVVFGLPAVALHYAGPWLAGGADDARSMLYPWLFELLLVGWACLAAGWPILWNGGLAAMRLRATTDLLTMLIVLASLLPAAAGIVALIATGQTWLGVSRAEGPMMHAALVAVMISTLQRWQFYRYADRVAGRAMLMIPRLGRLVMLMLILAIGATVWQGREMGLSVALLLPPLIGLGAIHRQSPGWSMALSVLGFVALMLLGPRALHLPIGGVAIEITAGFGMMMTGVFVLGWRSWPVADPRRSSEDAAAAGFQKKA